MDTFDSLVKKGNVLAFFSASWCGKCRALKPIIDDISRDIFVITVDADKNRDVCKKYGVLSLPTLIYFKNDEVYFKKSGNMNKDEIMDFLNGDGING